MPNFFSSLQASAAPERQVSEIVKIPAGVPPEYMYPMVFPPLRPSMVGTEISKRTNDERSRKKKHEEKYTA